MAAIALEPATTGPLPASYLTHELRAPLTAIRLGLEILQEQVQSRLGKDEKQMLSLAVKNTSRLEGLVNDILDYSKIIAGKLSVDKKPCDARVLVGDAVDGLQAVAISRGIKLLREGGEPLPRILADERRVVQILTNLISNAIKFTPARGQVSVSVKKGRYDHEGTLVFKVKDSGPGIPQQDIENIFDRLFHSKNPEGSQGTGLGLTLARLMVELHGGRIWAESWKGAGASLFFTVPIFPEDLSKKIDVYPKSMEYSGILVSIARRINAFLALFV